MTVARPGTQASGGRVQWPQAFLPQTTGEVVENGKNLGFLFRFGALAKGARVGED
jgi:hypothetical protein